MLDIDFQDMQQVSNAWNWYLLVVADRASKFVFAYPLEAKDYVGVARKRLELLLTFGAVAYVRRATID